MKEFDARDYVRPVTLPLPNDGLVSRQIRVGRLNNDFVPPVPLWWLCQARLAEQRSSIPIFVGLILWQQFKMKKTQPLRISGTVWRKLGLERRAVNRALRALENAGLITVKRFKHRSPAITIMTEKPRVTLENP